MGSVLTTPYSAAVVTLLYFDLRVRKEGLDLQLIAEGAGVVRDPDAPLPAPLVAEEYTPEERAQAPYWPPPPGWRPTRRPRPTPAGANRSRRPSGQPGARSRTRRCRRGAGCRRGRASRGAGASTPEPAGDEESGSSGG